MLCCVWRASPSGIDRVEMAYARHWLARPAAECTFVAETPWRRFAAVPRDRIGRLIDSLENAWNGAAPPGAPPGAALDQARGGSLRIQAALAFGAGRAALRTQLAGPGPCIFMLVSHRSLERGQGIAALRRAGAAFVPFVHDLIPLTHPEYTRPPQVRHHARRVATIAAQADGIIVNSAATAATLRPWLEACAARPHGSAPPQLPPMAIAPHGSVPPQLPPMAIAPLGLAPRPGVPPRQPGRASPWASPWDPPPPTPYFVCLGTIEPRKNHLLLLHLWRDLAIRLGPAAPRLVLIGRRGWENENILDMLERCEPLRGLVEERGTLGDATVTPLLAGARALLFPSFAEGYGLPLAEALALGVPAICSDLPALREVGGAVPDFLDPLDGAAWRRAILDYAAPDSAARAAQLARLTAWQAPGWTAHFATVEALLDQVAAHPIPRPVPRPVVRPAPLRPRPAARPAPVSVAWRPAAFTSDAARPADRPLASAGSPPR